MEGSDERLRDILIRGGYVSAENWAKAEGLARARHTSVDEQLLSQGLITKEVIGAAIAKSLNLPFANLVSREPSKEQVQKIPEAIARLYRAVLFEETDQRVTVTSDNPVLLRQAEELRKLFPGREFVLAYSLPDDIERAFVHYRKPLETRFGEIITKQQRVAPELIDEIVADAIILRASDIHFEPQESDVVIRYRIDGVLHEAARVSKARYENLLNVIKIISGMRIDEHFAAQDGAARQRVDNQLVDLRISVVPTVDGEKVAIRILFQYIRSFSLADLGLSEGDQQKLLTSARRPFGMLLVTGPTGSGKTTTLYAVLKLLNRPEINLMTIEDPVEYKITGANQIQVNPQTRLTFAQGLRSIVRQDPNVILVGEIRDEETAEIAVNAALTGHLLLTTFHANDAATAIPRLLDMGIEPFLLASTLELIIAQRLARRICDSCRTTYVPAPETLRRLLPDYERYLPKSVTLSHGQGCNACSLTGYRGRIALFEFISITPEMQELVLRNPPMREIWGLARTQGSRSLFEDGVDKVKAGLTTFEELLRVASPPINHG